MKQKKILLGVKIFGILHIIISSLLILGTISLIIFMIFMMPNIDKYLPEEDYNSLKIQTALQEYNTLKENQGYLIAMMQFVLVGLLGLVGLITGISILQLKSWARKLFIGLAIFVLSWRVISFILGNSINPLTLIYYGSVIWYFSTKNVKKAFS